MTTTLTDAKELFLNDCRYRRKLSEHTLKAYHLDLLALRRFVAASFPDDALDRLDRAGINAYLNSLSHCKARTVRRKLAAIKSLFTFLVREGLRRENPSQHIHTHLPKCVPLALPSGKSATYLNTGTWADVTRVPAAEAEQALRRRGQTADPGVLVRRPALQSGQQSREYRSHQSEVWHRTRPDVLHARLRPVSSLQQQGDQRRRARLDLRARRSTLKCHCRQSIRARLLCSTGRPSRVRSDPVSRRDDYPTQFKAGSMAAVSQWKGRSSRILPSRTLKSCSSGQSAA